MFTAIVTKIKDGDTFEIDFQGIPITIRLANIDVPERNTAFGKQIKKVISDLLLNQSVSFEVIKFDNCGRHLCNIIHNGKRLDELFVRNGWAWHWEKYSDNKNLVALEKEAFYAERGIWQPETLETFFGEAWKKSQLYATV